MNLSDKAKKELKKIFSEEYGADLSDEELSKIGLSLLRITKIGIDVLARADEISSSVEAREINSLEAKDQ